MDAHEAKSFIKLIQILEFFNILLGFNLFSPSDPIQAFVAQYNLHIFPPIKVIEGCKDPGSDFCWILHFTTILINNSSEIL